MLTSSVPSSDSLTDAAQPMPHRQILEAMLGMLAALFTAMISTNIISTALPTIIGQLNGTQSQYTWVITAALLATTVSTPIWGKLSDLINKKVLIQVAIVVFIVGSIGAGLSESVPILIAFRLVQGLGMGGLAALVQSIMATIISPRERGRYSGYMGAVMAVSTVSGPLLGGVIVDSALGWRWCFFVSVPLAIISWFLLQAKLRVPSLKRPVKVDYAGALLITLGASLPLLWVTFVGDNFAWRSWQTAAFLVPTALIISALVIIETRVAEPMIPLKLLKNRTAILVIIASVAVGVAITGGATFLGQYFQLARGNTPTAAGLMMTPLMVAMLASSTVAGQIASRTGRWKGILVFGSLSMLAGMAALSRLDQTTPLWQAGIFMTLMGLGMGSQMHTLVLAVQNSVGIRDIGAVSASTVFFRMLGSAIGVSVLGAILASQLQANIANRLARLGIPSGNADYTLDLTNLPTPVLEVVRAAYGDATSQIFLIGAIVSLIGVAAVLFIKEVPLRTTIGLSPSKATSDTAASDQDDDTEASPGPAEPRRVT